MGLWGGCLLFHVYRDEAHEVGEILVYPRQVYHLDTREGGIGNVFDRVWKGVDRL